MYERTRVNVKVKRSDFTFTRDLPYKTRAQGSQEDLPILLASVTSMLFAPYRNLRVNEHR